MCKLDLHGVKHSDVIPKDLINISFGKNQDGINIK